MAVRPRMILAFAHTPFQVICVAELCEYLRHVNGSEAIFPNLFVLGTPRANTTKASSKLANLFSLNHKVIRLPSIIPNAIASVIYLVICRWKLRNSESGDILVVGTGLHYRYVDLLERSKNLERWVVDDGTATIYLLRSFEVYGNPLRGVNWDRSFYRFFVRRVLRVKDPVWNEVRWYTIFYPEFTKIPNIKNNRLRLIKKSSSRAKLGNEIWFMGAPLIDAGIASSTVFACWIGEVNRRMRESHPGYTLRYILHPDEKPQYNSHRAAYEGFDDCVYFGEPVESAITSVDSVPKVVVSVLSTSILTLRELLPIESRIVVFLPDLRDISNQRIAHIKPIMEFLSKACKNRGIEVRRLAMGRQLASRR